MDVHRELEFRGIGVSPGIASGPVLLLKADDHPLPEYAIPAEEVPREMIRLEAALIETRRQLHEIQQRVGEAMGGESAGIFEAHLHVVDDPSFVDEVYRDVREKRKNIEKALFEVSERYAQTLLQMDDDYLRERATDIRDVTRRILKNLMGGGFDLLAGLETPRVLAARDIAPSEMAAFDRRKILGVVTELGSPTSHTAIMARAMDLPAIVGLRDLCGRLADGDRVILDGVRGVLVLNPSPSREEDYGRIARSRSIIQKRLATLKEEEAVTLDGHAVVLSANIEMPADVEAVWARGARGVGLFRSEYLYLARAGEPSEERQYQAYAEVARRILPESVIIRTLDLGGDKLPASVKIPEESNPFLGWRAIRLCLARPEIFKTQLRALLRASAHNPNLRIMYPMVSSAGEVDQAGVLLEECKAELAAAGVAFNPDVDVGVMVEIPSAALTADLIAPKVKFFSIGTNDLVQYTLAVDRVNERVAHLYEPTHPAVLKLIRLTVEAGRRHGIWTGVCGEMAGNPILTPLLLGLGVDELSASPGAIPLVKDVIRHIRFSEALELAEAARGMPTGAEVLERCRALVRRAAPEILELAE
ncbi:MAG: phosphoenolpyruvate--protein phosphotransferase [Opitutae bacterium]|nr:phosphoenolpyruvate--protein phosphotransferase [Opitutae bacterium]